MGYFTKPTQFTCFYTHMNNNTRDFSFRDLFSVGVCSPFFYQSLFQGLFHQFSRPCSHRLLSLLCESFQQTSPISPLCEVDLVKIRDEHFGVVVGKVPKSLKAIQTWHSPFNEVMFFSTKRVKLYFTQKRVTSRILLICASMIGVLFGQ